jgi:hypothetical protein
MDDANRSVERLLLRLWRLEYYFNVSPHSQIEELDK